MSRTLAVLTLVLACVSVCAGATQSFTYALVAPTDSASAPMSQSAPQFVAPKPAEVRALLAQDGTFFGFDTLRWPAKKISLDVKDADIRRLAKLLGSQTGIIFIVKDGVPKDLSITIQVRAMGAKQFLDTLCAATNLTYTAESRTDKADQPPGTGSSGAGIQREVDELLVTAPNQGSSKIYTDRIVRQPVTHVTISSLAAEGVIVNMGRVSLSVKNADPVEVATKLISQTSGASYILMDLKDYVALQDADRAAQIEKAVEKSPRRRITMSLRGASIPDALTQLAGAGGFYITAPQPGQNSFLIIPDVKVLDNKVMPGLRPSSLFFVPDMSQLRGMLQKSLQGDMPSPIVPSR